MIPLNEDSQRNLEAVAELQQRVAALEKQNRRFRKIGFASVAILGVTIFCGAHVIEDKLDIREQLLIRDRNRTVRLDIGVEAGNGRSNGLTLYDGDRKRKVELAIDPAGNGKLVFFDANDNVVRSYP